MPPLRERGDDIVDLARHFLQHHAQRYKRNDLGLSADAEAALRRHSWPGNVRELRNVMEQAVLMCGSGGVTARDLPIQGADGVVDGPAWSDADLNLERMERHLVELALSRTQHNVTQAAKLLGVSRDTLRYRLERLGFKSPTGD